jgi:hypothetical protein
MKDPVAGHRHQRAARGDAGIVDSLFKPDGDLGALDPDHPAPQLWAVPQVEHRPLGHVHRPQELEGVDVPDRVTLLSGAGLVAVEERLSVVLPADLDVPACFDHLAHQVQVEGMLGP